MADYVLIMFMIHTITIKLQLFDIVYRVIKVKEIKECSSKGFFRVKNEF